jgi:hypothetical protein
MILSPSAQINGVYGVLLMHLKALGALPELYGFQPHIMHVILVISSLLFLVVLTPLFLLNPYGTISLFVSAMK